MKTKRKVRFSLRALLLVFSLVAVVLAIYSERSMRQFRTVNRLYENECSVVYSNSEVALYSPAEEQWHSHFFKSVVRVNVSYGPAHPAGPKIVLVAKLPTVQELSIAPAFSNGPGGMPDDADLNLIENELNKLTYLRIFGTTKQRLQSALKDSEVEIE